MFIHHVSLYSRWGSDYLAIDDKEIRRLDVKEWLNTTGFSYITETNGSFRSYKFKVEEEAKLFMIAFDIPLTAYKIRP